ncbi:MAG TPA: class I SAM-dependent methyltransferase [Chloroflexi bacterium]|nr:class I SAM-dependent methyltransferase [Chloroflexota bacterium]
MERATLQRAQALYAGLSWRDRWHVRGRAALCPFERVADFVPRAGLIVDLGCGHGLFSHALALDGPERRIVGVELAAHKLAAARVAQSLWERPSPVRFVRGSALANPVAGPCRAILLIDVLYLFPPHHQERVLRASCERLERGGVLVLKTMDERPHWKAALNRMEEWLAVRAVRITLSEGGPFTFRSLAEWESLFRRIGFDPQAVRLDRGYYHPHAVVVGVRR